jgi:hypothetical protein
MGARRYRSVCLRMKNAPKFALVTAICACTCVGAMLQTGPVTGISLPTEVRLQSPGWWPTKGEPSREEYAGAVQCAKCHASETATYATTAMAHAAALAAASTGLRQHDRLPFQLGPFSYQILTSEKSVLSVSDGPSSLSRELNWAFGEGHMGQTYVYEQNGGFYEAHASFFTSLQALDITPGQVRTTPASLEDAAGRRMDANETRLCFGCHTTASTVKNQLDPHNAIPGVTCEACHGPGAKHVAAMSLGMETQADKQILNPGRLAPVESVDFCGACHRTWQDVVKNGLIGIGVYNVRFAPYRLENSKCWGSGDARITCIACHNPHKRLVGDMTSYDSACLRCHIVRGAAKSRDHPGAACPVAMAKCATCHMPKYEPPGLHSAFTDHWIRVVQPGKPYPD